MLWDASQAFGEQLVSLATKISNMMQLFLANNRYDLVNAFLSLIDKSWLQTHLPYTLQAIKNALVADGGTGFTFPPCSAAAFVPGTNYQGGSQVSFDGSVRKPGLLHLSLCLFGVILFKLYLAG
jgi:hypothetical protein